MFFIEGKKMIEEAMWRKELLLKVFVDEGYEKEYGFMDKTRPGIEKYILDSKLMKIICDTETPQGIAAVVKKPAWCLKSLIEKNGFFILLDRISDPGNMGTIIRTGWALGVNGILLTKGCVDPFGPKVVRSSMGGIFNLPVFVDFLFEDIKLLKKKNYSFICASPDAGPNFYSMDFTGPEVLVIGSESRGASEEIKGVCDEFFKIPLNPRVDSLNAAVACAIIINEACKQRGSFSLF